jgi:hypothetical protein
MLYTLPCLIPTLAIVQSHTPPEYQQLAVQADDDEWNSGGGGGSSSSSSSTHKTSDDDGEDVLEGDATKMPLHLQQQEQQPRKSKSHGQQPTCNIEEPVVPRGYSSIRQLHKALYRIKGLRSMFHGMFTSGYYTLAMGFVTVAVSAVPFVGGPLGYTVGSLLTVQFAVRWNHRMLTAPEGTLHRAPSGGGRFRAFTLRLPPFGTTLRATALPTLLVLAADAAVLYVPALVASAATRAPVVSFHGLLLPGGKNSRGAMAGDTAAVYVSLQLLLSCLLQIPAAVVLTRIQAALLVDNDVRTVVPVDRTFGMPGGLFPAERDGVRRGWLASSWLSVVAAFRSFKGQWFDFYIFLLKVSGIILALELAIGLVLGLQFFLIPAAIATKGY